MMKTKFKKGDRVRAVKSDSFGIFNKGDEGLVEYVGVNTADVRINDTLFKTTHRGLQEGFELITAEPKPRLASEMTLRERFDAAKEIYIELIQLGRPAGNGTAKVAAKAVHTLIQALNEKP